MKFELKKIHRNTSDSDLILDLQRVAKIFNTDTLSRSEYSEEGTYHDSTYGRRFGSWAKALERAGLKSKFRQNIPDEELFNDIENVWTKLGRQPKYREMKVPLSKFSASTFENRFGTWMKCLEKFVEHINQDVDSYNIEIEKKQSSIQELKKIDENVRRTKRDISDRLRFRILMRDGFTCRPYSTMVQRRRNNIRQSGN